jgi:hypothetical protein
MTLNLIAGWKAAWRYHVVIAGALLAAASAAYGYSDAVKALVTPQTFALFTLAMGVAIPVLRVIAQPNANMAVLAASLSTTVPALVAAAAETQHTDVAQSEPAVPVTPTKDTTT